MAFVGFGPKLECRSRRHFIREEPVPLRQAKALDPSHFSYPQVFLVEIYARRNQLQAAIAEIEEFLKLHPDSEVASRMRKALEDARERLSSKP